MNDAHVLSLAEVEPEVPWRPSEQRVREAQTQTLDRIDLVVVSCPANCSSPPPEQAVASTC